VPIADQDSVQLRQELELAAQVQRSLLPAKQCCFEGWKTELYFQPMGFVSGDYVDLIPAADGGFHFVLGDVSGKGVAASLLMSHLHATLRTLLATELPLEQVLTKASAMFCEVSLPAQFATIIVGAARPNGEVLICNAGHPPALLASESSTRKIVSQSMPVGMFCEQAFTSERLSVEEGGLLLLYSDGITESEKGAGEEYGETRLLDQLRHHRSQGPTGVVHSVIADVDAFTAGVRRDDRAILALFRTPTSAV
jgi:sigma-B regulation protein RsbU (phosphoserine phosphatase)